MQCKSPFSCRGRCTRERELGGTEEKLQCFCDNSCDMLQDCCADFDQFCSLTEISAQDTKTTDDNGLWECFYSKPSSDIGVWMISSCPRNWTQADIKEHCSKRLLPSYVNLTDNAPVIDRKGKTYKNHYCVQCHGLNLNEFIFYHFQFGCDVPVTKQYKKTGISKFLSSFCDRPFWRPPKGSKRRYCLLPALNASCSNSSVSATVQQKCLNGPLRVVHASSVVFRRRFFNPYCALCSNVKVIECGPLQVGGIGQLAKSFSFVIAQASHHRTSRQSLKTPAASVFGCVPRPPICIGLS